MSRKSTAKRVKLLEQAMHPSDNTFRPVPPWIEEKGPAAVAAWRREGNTWQPVYLPPVRE
jgi:hypothetical protein